MTSLIVLRLWLPIVTVLCIKLLPGQQMLLEIHRFIFVCRLSPSNCTGDRTEMDDIVRKHYQN